MERHKVIDTLKEIQTKIDALLKDGLKYEMSCAAYTALCDAGSSIDEAVSEQQAHDELNAVEVVYDTPFASVLGIKTGYMNT